MPLVSNTNVNTTILTDIINWLSQIKVAGTTNSRMLDGEFAVVGADGFDLGDVTLDQLAGMTLDQLANLPLAELDCNLSFYSDAARTNLLYTANTGANAADFSINQNK